MLADEIKPKFNRQPNDMKYIQVTDPCIKKKIFDICHPPDVGTQYTFWYCISTDSWGLTIKAMERNPKGKTSEVVWKVSWVYNADKNILFSGLSSRNLLKETTIEGTNADSLKEIYEIYKRG